TTPPSCSPSSPGRQGRDQQLILVERIREAEHAGDRAKKEMSDTPWN
ncbi:MAG: hypothetical protein FJ102_17415, partial [Deltaproteobacteria bacterium]|nr:hypothetical protein [Deltaproteobacteria bacterium]